MAGADYISYGSWAAIGSILCLIIFGFWTVFSAAFIFSIFGLIFAIFMMFLEIPFLTSCCTGPKMQKYQEFFKKPYLRGGLYLFFAFVMFLSCTITVGLLLIPAFTLLISSVFYAMGAFQTDRERREYEAQIENDAL